MSEWMPIESAPNGKWVLVHYSKSVTDKDPDWFWERGMTRSFVAKRRGKRWEEGDEYIITPTHWMPLPEPPKE